MEALIAQAAAEYVRVGGPKWVLVALVAGLVLVLIAAGRRQKRQVHERFEVRVCPKCGTNGPPHAMFCAKCGTRV